MSLKNEWSSRFHCSIKLQGLDIHEAIQSKFWTPITQFLDKGEFLCNTRGDNCFVLAAKHKDWPGLLRMLEHEPSGLQCKDEEGKSLLYLSRTSAAQVLGLLKLGADIKDPDIASVLACLVSSQNSRDNLVMQVLEWLHRANVPMTDSCGGSLLKYCGNQSLALILKLYKLGASVHDPDFKDVLKRKVIECKIEQQRELAHLLTYILTDSWDFKLEDKEGVSLLCYCDRTKPFLFKHLLYLGADVTDPRIKDLLRLMLLPGTSFITDILKLASQRGLKMEDSLGTSFVVYSPLGWDLSVLLCLLQLGADPHVHNIGDILRELAKPPHSPTKYEIFKLLHASNVKLKDKNHRSLLLYSSHSPEQFRYMLDLGANLEFPEIHKVLQQLLMKARPEAEKDVSHILSAVHKAKIPLVDAQGDSLIEHAVSSPYIVWKLIDLGATNTLKNRVLVINKIMTYLNMNRSGSSENIDKLVKTLAPVHNYFRNVERKVLSDLLYQCLLLCLNFKKRESFNVLHFVMNNLTLVGHDSTTLQYDAENHPHNALLTATEVSSSTIKLLDIFFRSSFKDLNHCVSLNFSYAKDIKAGFLAAFVHKTRSLRAIPKLLQLGLAKTTGLSVLAVMAEIESIIDMSRSGNQWEETLALVETHVDVGAKSLIFKHEWLQYVSKLMCVPDVLIIAKLNCNLKTVLRYCSHFSWPPLGLLVFQHNNVATYDNTEIQWFTSLLKLGRVPHGTPVFRAVRQQVSVWRLSFPEHVHTMHCECALRGRSPLIRDLPEEQLGGVLIDRLTLFDFAHRSPLTLVELSRYAVKQALARSKPYSLAEAYKTLCPPGLADHLIDAKIEALRSLYPLYEEESVLYVDPPSLLLSTCLLPSELLLDLSNMQELDDTFSLNSDYEVDMFVGWREEEQGYEVEEAHRYLGLDFS